MIFIQSGRGEFTVDGKLFFGQAGDLIVFEPSKKNQGKSSLDQPLKGISVRFTQLHIAGLDKGALTRYPSLPIIHLQEEAHVIDKYFIEMLNEYNSQHDGYEDIVSSMLQTIIIKLFRLSNYSLDPSSSSISQTVKKYIEANFSKELTLNDLATLVFVSPYHLAHSFKEEVGVPPIQYIINCRIEEAKRLLQHSNLSVREIAAIVGYENANYFNLLFKKVTGNPPGKYRKMKN